MEPWGLSKSLVSTADRPSQSLATRLRFTRTSSHSGKTGRSKLPISRAQVSCRGCLRNLCINHRSLLTRAWPATGKPRIGNEFSPSFSVLGFPVSRLPSPKVARTARRIDNRRLQRGFASDFWSAVCQHRFGLRRSRSFQSPTSRVPQSKESGFAAIESGADTQDNRDRQ